MKMKLVSQWRRVVAMGALGWMVVGVVPGRAQSPDPVRAAFERGVALEESERDLGRAAEAYEEALRAADARRPFHASLIFRLAETRRRQGRTAEAAELYRRIVGQFPDQPELVASAQKQLGTGTMTPADGMRLARLQRQLAQSEARALALAERLRESAAKRERYQRVRQDRLLGTIAQDEPAWTEAQNILRRRLELETQRAADSASYGDAHPKLRELSAQLIHLANESHSLAQVRMKLLEVESTQLAEEIGREAAVRSKLEVELAELQRATAGMAVGTSAAAGADPSAILDEEIQVAEQQVELAQKRFESGVLSESDVLKLKREVLALQRQRSQMRSRGPVEVQAAGAGGMVAAAPVGSGGGQPGTAGTTSAVPMAADEEGRELARLKRLKEESPDLLSVPRGSSEQPLSLAAVKGWGTVLDYLLGLGEGVIDADQRGQALSRGAKAGRLDSVKRLLGAGAVVDWRDTQGFTALHHAASSGHRSVVETLLNAGALVDAGVEPRAGGSPVSGVRPGHTALALAAQQKWMGVMELLLARGAKPSAESGALEAAVLRGWDEGAARLLAAGADPNAPEVLVWAARQADVGLVKRLLAAGADPNQTDSREGRTALSFAAARGEVVMVEALLAAGASILAGDQNGYTPMDWAQTEAMQKWFQDRGGRRNSVPAEGSQSMIGMRDNVRCVLTGALSGSSRGPGDARRLPVRQRRPEYEPRGPESRAPIGEPVAGAGGQASPEPLRLFGILREAAREQSGSPGYAPDFSRVRVRTHRGVPGAAMAAGVAGGVSSVEGWERDVTLDLTGLMEGKADPARDLDLGDAGFVTVHVSFLPKGKPAGK